MRNRNKALGTVALTVGLTMNAMHDGYENHWWWDNVTHFLGGFFLGLVLPKRKERETFLVIATIWECFEWWAASRKICEVYETIPEGCPRSMGFDGWSFDHQVEDTILDTVMGYYGVKVAQKLK